MMHWTDCSSSRQGNAKAPGHDNVRRGFFYLNETEYNDGAYSLNQYTVRGSVTLDDETGLFLVEEFRHGCPAPWQ